MKTKWHMYISWSVFSLVIEGLSNTEPVNDQHLPALLGPSSDADSAYLPDVSVTCSTADFVVRVRASFYGLYAHADELRLGRTCRSNGAFGPHGDLLFTFPVTGCDVTREVSPGYIVYKHVLRYTPSLNRRPAGSARSYAVNIECRYARYQHVYQLAVRPTWQTALVRKSLKAAPNRFQIQLMDDTWNMPAKSQTYVLGQTVNLQVSASHLPSEGKVYVRSCLVRPHNGSTSSPLEYTLIDNSGCMVASRKDPGRSRFVPSQDAQTTRFSISAFQFTSDPNTEVQIHCELHVSLEGSSALHKACTYEGNRWRALSGDDDICDCCESQCVTSKSKPKMLEGSANSGPILVSEDRFLSVIPILVNTTEKTELKNIWPLKSDITVPGQGTRSTRANNDDEEEQKNTKDLEVREAVEEDEVEEELEGDGIVWVEPAKATGRLNQVGFGSWVITMEWQGEMSGTWDLDELGEDGGLRKADDNDDLLSTASSETEETVPENEARKFSGERGLSLLEKEEVESRVTAAQRNMSTSGEMGTTRWAWKGLSEQPHDGRHEEEGGDERDAWGER